MFGHGINKLFRAPVRLCLWLVFTLLNFSNRYSGARLFIVLNIKDFNCFSLLPARFLFVLLLFFGIFFISSIYFKILQFII